MRALEARLAGLRREPLPMLDPHPSSRAEIRSARPPGDFESMVGEATDRIGAGEMHKVVLAREVIVTSPAAHEPGALFGAMREQFSSCFCFCCGTPEAAFFGASPELLVRRSGASVSTVALAGSTRRSSDPAVDDHLGEQLLRSDKNRREQRIVSERIVRILRPHAVWVEAAAEPEVIKVANIQHLGTPVIAQLAEPRSAVELAGLMHPTPAVGGEPHARAIAAIAEMEEMDRGWYAGPIGWMDATEDGEFCVGLRSASAARPRRPPLRGRRRRRRLRAGRRARGDRDQAPGPAAAADVSARRLAACLVPLLAALAAPGGGCRPIPPGPRLAVQNSWQARSAGAQEPRAILCGGTHPLPNLLSAPSWSADGGSVAFSGQGGKVEGSAAFALDGTQVYVAAADGSSLRSVPETTESTAPVFSPDGQTIAFERQRRKTRSNATGGEDVVYESTTVWLADLRSGQSTRLTLCKMG